MLECNKVTVNHDNYFRVNWGLGNQCMFSCSYCTPLEHDGSIPWMDLKHCKKVAKIIIDNNRNKIIQWTFLGGEITVWKDFLSLIQWIKEYNSTSIIMLLTNGNRTVRYWNKAKYYIDRMLISVHLEFIDPNEVKNVVNECADTIPWIGMFIMALPHRWDVTTNAMEILKTCDNYNVLRYKILTDWYNREGIGYASEDEFIPYEDWQKDIIISEIYNKHNPDTYNSEFPKWQVHMYSDDILLEQPTMSEIYANKQNTWTGWNCYAGKELIFLNKNGGVWSSDCKHKYLGNWKINPEDIHFLQEPIVCEKEWCWCGDDVFATKIR